MKKLFILIMVLIMVLGIVGCSAAPAEEAVSTPQPTEEATQSPEATEENAASIELGTPVTAGNWEYTLVNIEFADDIGNYSEYENYLVPGGKTSNTNPFRLEEDEMFAVVTYKLKMIGKETLRGWDEDLFCAVGTGKFIYGDGFVFENNTTEKRAEPSFYDGSSFEMNDLAWHSLEPLSDEIECRVAFCVPSKVVEDTSEPLLYEIEFGGTGDNMTFTYIVR